MKKCNRYLDALDQNAQEDSSLWQDVLMHAARCADCSFDMQVRTEMLEKLSELPEPVYPSTLHEEITNAVKESGVGEIEETDSGFLARLFDRFLQPVEILVPAACILMFVFLIQLNHEAVYEGQSRILSGGQNRSSVVKMASLPAVGDQELEKVSGEEVREFLDKLEEFRRAHPESHDEMQHSVPAIELVNDRNFRRQP